MVSVVKERPLQKIDKIILLSPPAKNNTELYYQNLYLILSRNLLDDRLIFGK